MTNLENQDLIRSILLECGYFGFMIRFWILQTEKKRKIRFLDLVIRFRIFPKKRTLNL